MAFKGSSVEKSMAEPRWRSLLFSRKASHGLGVALIIFGSMQILLQISLLILETLFVQIKNVHRVSCWVSATSGIWCGCGIVAGGVVAIVAGRKGTRSWITANNIFSVVAFLLACLIIVSSGFYVLDLISDRRRIFPGNFKDQTVSTAFTIDSMLGSELEWTTQPLENPPSNVSSSGDLYWKTRQGSRTTEGTWSRISEDAPGRWRMESGTSAEGVNPPKSTTTTRSWWDLIGSDEDYLNVDDEDDYIDSGNKKLPTATTTKPTTDASLDEYGSSGGGLVDDEGDDDDEYFENYEVTRDVKVSSTLTSSRASFRIRREDPNANLNREECSDQNFFWWIVALTHLSLLTLTGVVEVLLTVVSGSNSCLSLCRGPSEELDDYCHDTFSQSGSAEDCPLLTDLYPNKDDFTSARGLIDV